MQNSGHFTSSLIVQNVPCIKTYSLSSDSYILLPMFILVVIVLVSASGLRRIKLKDIIIKHGHHEELHFLRLAYSLSDRINLRHFLMLVVISFSIMNSLLLWLWVNEISIMPNSSYFTGLFLLIANLIALVFAYKRHLLERY